MLFGNPIREFPTCRQVTGTYQARTLDDCATGDPTCGGGTELRRPRRLLPTATQRPRRGVHSGTHMTQPSASTVRQRMRVMSTAEPPA
ncbi:hypothetical protein [Streptomyces soliscabiei]|uniref:hypothetical protein n=1 Tax=Streptomyces soliscabiei TaxID=588897 RepID=UPI0029B95DE0|nr:hypothetical protein [Streptomyces sp. NY05-11A]MDX2676661.1 hypothetical protein [Streptomyces sp. NY05-11A]